MEETPYLEFENSSQPAINDININQMQKLIKKHIQELDDKISSLQSTVTNISNAKVINNCDFDELINNGTGHYIAFAKVTNGPNASDSTSNMHYYVIQIVYNSEYCVQIAISLHSFKSIYVRRKIVNSWKKWVSVNSQDLSLENK